MELYSAESAKIETLKNEYIQFKRKLHKYDNLYEVCNCIKDAVNANRYTINRITAITFEIPNDKIENAKEDAENLRELGYDSYVIGNKLSVKWGYDTAEMIKSISDRNPNFAVELSEMLDNSIDININN